MYIPLAYSKRYVHAIPHSAGEKYFQSSVLSEIFNLSFRLVGKSHKAPRSGRIIYTGLVQSILHALTLDLTLDLN